MARWPRNVVALGLVSLLNDAASEMVVPLLPLFLASLGAGGLALGVVEGSAESVASVLKYVAGRASDRTRRTLPFLATGYGLAAGVRPFLAIATGPAHVFVVRVVDRVGKGLRTAPRDALLAASVTEAERGGAFGLHRAMDHAGAVIGPLLAMGLLLAWPGDLRRVFLFALIPGLLSMGVLFALVRERPRPPQAEATAPEVPSSEGLWRLLVPVGLGTLGTASDTFLMLAAGARETPLLAVPLLWMGLHVVRVTSSAVGGRLADALAPHQVVTLGWGIRAVCLGGLAWVTTPVWTAAWVLAFGIAGLSEPGEKKLVAATVGAHKRGTAYGAYHLVVGATALPASAGFGLLWDLGSPRAAFLTSSLLVGLAAILLSVLLRERGLDAP